MGGQYLFAKNSMEKEKQICIIYIFYVCFGITKKTLPAFYEETELLILKEELLCVISFFLMFFIIIWFLLFIYQLSFTGFPMLMLILFTLNQPEMSLGT